MSEVPESLKKAGLSLSQANVWAKYYDQAKKQNAKAPAGVAWTIFKKKYKKVGDKWVAHESKKGESRMSDSKDNSDIDYSLFQGDGDIDKLKNIISKLENADTIEAAKVLVVELKDLLPVVPEEKEETPEEVTEDKKEEKTKDSEEEDKETVEKEEKAEDAAKKKAEEASKAAEEKKPETEEPKEEKPSSLQEALDLNEEMITQLQEAHTQIETLEKINSKYKKDISVMSAKLKESEGKLSQFASAEKSRKEKKYNAKLKEVLEKYCSFMGIPSGDRVSVEKMMSTYSEDMLDKTLGYIEDRKISQLQEEEDPKTVPSSDLSKAEKTKSIMAAYEKIDNSREKTDFIFDMMIGKDPIN